MTRPLTEISRRHVLGGGVILAGAGALAACASPGGNAAPVATGTPHPGGTLRFGLTDNSADLADAQNVTGGLGIPLAQMAYGTLMGPNLQGVSTYLLAEEVTSNADATEWTIRLREGVPFHSGKILDADDLIFTVRRAPDTLAATAWAWTTGAEITKLDPRTVRFTLPQPYSILRDQLGLATGFILPANFTSGFTDGTGPWRVVSTDPGRGARLERFEGYWRGPALLDAVEISQFADPSGLLNAFLSGQIDAMDQVSVAQQATLTARPGFTLQRNLSRSAAGRHISMNMSIPPYDDVRVRQAMRLIADRPQMAQQVYNGNASVQNDVRAAVGTAGYDPDLQQRVQDIDRAKSLLRQAGLEGATFELATTSAYSDMVETAQSFAAQANQNGITVQVSQKDPATYFSTALGTNPFMVSLASGSYPYLTVTDIYFNPNSPYNETKWSDPEWFALQAEALRTTDDARRQEIVFQMQRIDWERGVEIIWSSAPTVSAFSSKFSGYPAETYRGDTFAGYDFTTTYQV